MADLQHVHVPEHAGSEHGLLRCDSRIAGQQHVHGPAAELHDGGVRVAVAGQLGGVEDIELQRAQRNRVTALKRLDVGALGVHARQVFAWVSLSPPFSD